MASLEAALIAALKADAGVTALAGTRVSIRGGTQGTAYPYVTIQRITTPTASYLDGPSNLDWPTIQIDVWSPKGLDAIGVAEAIRSVLDNNALEFLGVSFEASFQDQRGPAPDEETRNYSVSQDYVIFQSR